MNETPGHLLIQEAAKLALSAGKSIEVKGAGRSMGRWFQDADAILLTPLNGRRLRPGQVLVFSGRERWVAHRLIGFHKDGRFITKADALSFFDEPAFSPGDVRGQVAGIRRRGRVHSMSSLGGRLQALIGLMKAGRLLLRQALRRKAPDMRTKRPESPPHSG